MHFGNQQGPAIRSKLFSRNLAILLFAQAVAVTGWFAVVTAGGILGGSLAANPALATLPVSLLVVGNAVATIIASWTMARVGRARGFAIGHGGRLRSSLCFPCDPDPQLRAALWRLDHFVDARATSVPFHFLPGQLQILATKHLVDQRVDLSLPSLSAFQCRCVAAGCGFIRTAFGSFTKGTIQVHDISAFPIARTFPTEYGDFPLQRAF